MGSRILATPSSNIKSSKDIKFLEEDGGGDEDSRGSFPLAGVCGGRQGKVGGVEYKIIFDTACPLSYSNLKYMYAISSKYVQNCSYYNSLPIKKKSCHELR